MLVRAPLGGGSRGNSSSVSDSKPELTGRYKGPMIERDSKIPGERWKVRDREKRKDGVHGLDELTVQQERATGEQMNECYRKAYPSPL